MYKIGKITPVWSNEYKLFDYQKGSYYQSLDSMFLDTNLKYWESQGYDSTSIVGYRYLMNDKIPTWVNELISRMNGENYGFCFFKMMSGNVIPYHKDIYTFYRKLHNITNPTTIWRAIVFLEDWRPGHLFEIEDRKIDRWQAGTYVTWNNDAYHMAANIGEEPRYTLQITYTR
jgi:hypothetical protein